MQSDMIIVSLSMIRRFCSVFKEITTWFLGRSRAITVERGGVVVQFAVIIRLFLLLRYTEGLKLIRCLDADFYGLPALRLWNACSFFMSEFNYFTQHIDFCPQVQRCLLRLQVLFSLFLVDRGCENINKSCSTNAKRFCP